MEDLNLRFPHISWQIFANLSNKDLAQCREVSTSFCDFIDNEKIPWIRMIKKYVQSPQQQEVWRRLLRRINTEIERELACSVHQFYTKHPKSIGDGKSTLHFAAMTGQMHVFEILY